MAITSDNHVAKATGFMMLSLLGIARGRIKFGSFDPGGQSLKVSIYDVRCLELFVVVDEHECFLCLLRHSSLHRPPTYSFAVGLVLFKEVSSLEAVKTPFTEVFSLMMPVVVIQKAVKVLDPGVMLDSSLLYQQKIGPSDESRGIADPQGIDTFVIAKDIDGHVVLILHPLDLGKFGGAIDSSEVQGVPIR